MHAIGDRNSWNCRHNLADLAPLIPDCNTLIAIRVLFGYGNRAKAAVLVPR